MQLFYCFFPPNHSFLEALTFRILNSRRSEEAPLIPSYNKHLQRVNKAMYCYLSCRELSPGCDHMVSKQVGQEINGQKMN